MDAMVLEMLELSRLEAGKVHLATDRVALLQLVKAVEEKLSPLAEEKQIRFAYPLVEEFTLLADEARIEQMLTNLMGNAIKYSPPGATVSVKVFRDGSAARFKIQNPSPPLSNEALEKVWDSFYRADPARSQPGTGLGLALVKTIVELHRGKCAVRNVQLTENDVLPTGVEFSISLPLE
jgi:signal transduction histidine kinase